MRVVPVIARELRASARQSFTYSLRVLGVVALLIVLGIFGLEGNLGPEIGGRLFGSLHCTLFIAIWVLVPLATADCISRERREGTLPLLFLTNLNPRDIVYAKGLAHGLRSFTLWLAVLPLLTVPLVARGVGWPEVLMSALVNFSSVCLATAAGLIASSISRNWTRALAVSLCLAFVFFIVSNTALPLIVIGSSGVSLRRFAWMMNDWGPGAGLAFAVNWDGVWQQWLGAFRGKPWPLLQGYGTFALLSLCFLILFISMAAWRVRRAWREEPASARVQWLKQKLFTPMFFQPVLRRWLGWQLRRNPIGWLEQRSWSGRLVVWSWFAIVICIYSSLFSNLGIYQRGFHQLQTFLASLLAVSISLSAAGSFRRERESGVLELLLVSPIREWQIIAGRVRGLWMQFLPAMLLLCAVWLYCSTFLSNENEVFSVLIYSVTFATLPVIGLYYSLARSNFIAALIWTLLVGIALPSGMARIVALSLDVSNSSSSSFLQPAILVEEFLPCLIQLGLAVLFAARLHHHLRYRKFALERK